MTSPSWGFSLAVSGMMMPPVVFSSGFDPLDDDAIVKWTELHDLPPNQRHIFRCDELGGSKAWPWKAFSTPPKAVLGVVIICVAVE
jgi:hypothetical protein